jgi:hypothetical protein
MLLIARRPGWTACKPAHSTKPTFGVGFHDWHPQRQFDIYYDDLVLDSKRVGCPPQ